MVTVIFIVAGLNGNYIELDWTVKSNYYINHCGDMTN